MNRDRDKLINFSDCQIVNETTSSTNIMDLGLSYQGDYVVIKTMIEEDFNNLNFLRIAIEVDDNLAFSSVREVLSQSIMLDGLEAGKQSTFHVLPKGIDERYMRVVYTVHGDNPTEGKISTWIVQERDAA